MTDNTTEHPSQWGTTQEQPSWFHRVHNGLSRYIASIDAAEMADRVNHPARTVRKYHQAVGQRSQEIIRQRVLEGWWFGPTPYGYEVRQRRDIDGRGRAGHRRWLIPDPRRGPVVPVIFGLSLDNQLDTSAIVAHLAGDPDRYPGPVDGVHGGNRTWTTASIRTILTNPAYVGYVVWGRTHHGQSQPHRAWTWSTHPTHPALVTPCEFWLTYDAVPPGSF